MTILEVDEYQYKKKEYNCKVKRMWDITQVLDILTLFIHYNPDSYMTSDRIQNDSNNKKRTHKLLSCIWDVIHLQSVKELQFLQAIYLFYDGYDKSNTEITTVSDA